MDLNLPILDLDPETELGSESSSSSTKRSLAEFGDTLYSTISTKPVGSGGEYLKFNFHRLFVLTIIWCRHDTSLNNKICFCLGFKKKKNDNSTATVAKKKETVFDFLNKIPSSSSNTVKTNVAKLIPRKEIKKITCKSAF
jgi:hypothetical protein